MRCCTVRTRSMATTSWSAIALESASRALIFVAEIAATTTRARITTPKATPRRYASLRLLKRDTVASRGNWESGREEVLACKDSIQVIDLTSGVLNTSTPMVRCRRQNDDGP